MGKPGRTAALAGLVFCAALAVRLFVSFRTALPSVDGVIFLSMAKDMAAGHWAPALVRVFHPFYPLLAAPLIALGVTPFTAARVLLSVFGAAGAALVLPLARELGASRGASAALASLAAVSVWASRYAGDAYSEPLFLFLAALASWLYLRQARSEGKGRALTAFFAGFLAGLAFTTRPEGAALGAAFLLAGPGRVFLALGAVLPAGAYLGARWVLLGSLAPTPKLGFMLPMGPLGATGVLEGLALYLENLGKALLLGFESLGPLGWLLSAAGILLFLFGRKGRRGQGGKGLAAALLLAFLGMAAFQVKRRFLLDWSPLLLAFGALAWDALSGKVRFLLPVLLALSLGWSLVRLYPPRKYDKTGEVLVARWIGARLGPGEGIVTDMPRVAYYAGLRPPPPRVPAPEDVARWCARAGVRFLVLGARRRLFREFGPPKPWKPAPLPPEVERAARRRGIAVFIRPRK